MKTIRCLIIIWLIMLLGCGKNVEKNPAAINALDVSGQYSDDTGSKLLAINNEAGSHDIVVILTRTQDDFSADEMEFLNKKGINIAWVNEQLGLRVELGKGKSSHLENGSVDGHISNIDVCSRDMLPDQNMAIVLRYCLTAKFVKEDQSLAGKLYFQVTTKTQVQVEGKIITKTETFSAERKRSFSATKDVNDDTTFFGAWYGPLYANDRKFDGPARLKVSLQQIDHQGVIVQPLPKNLELTYNDVVFKFKQQTLSATEFDSIPTIVTWHFESTDKQKIIFYGQIWSTTNFTGAIVYIDQHDEKQIGSFHLKK